MCIGLGAILINKNLRLLRYASICAITTSQRKITVIDNIDKCRTKAEGISFNIGQIAQERQLGQRYTI